MPVVAVLALVGAVVRALGQLAAKQPGLAVDEVRAALVALARPDGVLRARLGATRSRRLPRRALRPLQAGWRDVWSQARDRRLARAEARRVVQAPSELELRELAGLATRRRATLAAVVAVLVVLVAVALGPLVAPVAAAPASSATRCCRPPRASATSGPPPRPAGWRAGSAAPARRTRC